VHSLDRLLERLFASRNPVVVFVRESIRRNRVVLSGARGFIRAVRGLPTLLGQFKKFLNGRSPLEPIVAARETGGFITVAELEQIWQLARGARTRVLAIASGPELEQIRIVVRAARKKAFFAAVSAAEIDAVTVEDFDLIIAVPVPETERRIAELQTRAPSPDRVLRVGASSKRSDYYRDNSSTGETVGGVASAGVARSVPRAVRPRLVLLNDVGFQYGAGIALRRQACSFLLNGFEVHLVAWTPGVGSQPPMIAGIANHEGWGGVHVAGKGRSNGAKSPDQLVAGVLSIIRALKPDVIITGNLHGTGFALELAQALKTVGTPVVSYMHDCFWATGRCAYPLACQLYQTGCNETCPTADEYPRLAPDKIAPAWRTKTDIFEGETGIPLVTNSGWTRGLAVRRFGDRARIDCVPLAIDHELFSPIPKAVARRLLDLPTEGLFVVMGAVDILNKWKGGNLFREIHGKLQERGDVSILLFGQSSTMLKSRKSFGLVNDERLMPFILNAADIFVGTATEEAFGQTLLEASACGIPVVAFDRGGVSDIVVHEQTGLLVKNLSVSELYGAVDRLLADPSLRDVLGRNGRKRVESHFTLGNQADAWTDYLETLSHPTESPQAAARDAF
jgi:glycosyltransferase involved in cell wall biosynthesis